MIAWLVVEVGWLLRRLLPVLPWSPASVPPRLPQAISSCRRRRRCPLYNPCCAAGKLPFEDAPQDDRSLADIHLALYNDVVVFDHATKLAFVISWVRRLACSGGGGGAAATGATAATAAVAACDLHCCCRRRRCCACGGCPVCRFMLNSMQVHLGDYGSVEEAYLAGRRRLAATAAKLTSQNAPPLLNGKVCFVWWWRASRGRFHGGCREVQLASRSAQCWPRRPRHWCVHPPATHVTLWRCCRSRCR